MLRTQNHFLPAPGSGVVGGSGVVVRDTGRLLSLYLSVVVDGLRRFVCDLREVSLFDEIDSSSSLACTLFVLRLRWRLGFFLLAGPTTSLSPNLLELFQIYFSRFSHKNLLEIHTLSR